MPIDIPITLKNRLGQPPKGGDYPITTGIPFPSGLIRDGENLELCDASGRPVRHDLTPTSFWSDGSWQWAVLEFMASLSETDASDCVFHLRSAKPAITHDRLQWKESSDRLDIDTGKARFSFSKNIPWPFEIEGLSPVSKPDASQPKTASPQPLYWQDAGGNAADYQAEAFTVLHTRKHSIAMQWRGRLTSPSGKSCNLQMNATCYADSGLVRFAITLWNANAASHPGGLWDLGDPGSVYFKQLRLSLRLPTEGAFYLNLHPEQPEQWPCGAHAILRQDSSGNESWRHPTHADRSGNPTPQFRGYRLKTEQASQQGEQANPVLLYQGPQKNLALAFENFREAFPKGFRVTGDTCHLEPFPPKVESELGPLEAEGGAGDFELQGGEKTRCVFWMDAAASTASPHTLLVNARVPVYASVPYDWHMRCEVWGPHLCQGQLGHALLTNLETGVIEGPHSFFSRREKYEELGWRNFGEVAADHELLHYKGEREFVSHYNNQYDLIQSFLQRFASTGDNRWFALGHDLAQHVLHHDLYHTEQDKPAYNGGYFWHTAHYLHAGTATHRTFSKWAYPEGKPPSYFGGGPSNEHNYSSGLVWYYRLTGDQAAYEAVLQLARWVRNMQSGDHTILRFLSRNPTGLATCTRELAFQGPGRGAGYSINTCLDAFDLTRDATWLQLAESLIAACIHPEDDPSAMGLLNREERWSYVIFLQVLGKYLETKYRFHHQDQAFAYARASLVHYADWMVAHEYPYLDKPDELEFPTSTWAAQDLRKVAVFLNAARWAPRDQAEKYRERAAFFQNKSIHFLQNAKDASTVRNLALILGQAPMFEYVASRWQEWLLDLPAPTGTYAPKQTIIPQKIQAKRNLKLGAATLGIALAGKGLFWLAKRALKT